jgi:NAD(P)H dehydrogenase (quinone)
MNIFIVYAHPSEDSFTRFVRDEFIRGLEDSNHNYEISDLYKMNFRTDMSESEYLREANYQEDKPLSDDIILEQKKINRNDILVFIYPVFWTEAPAKLVGWFDRVWTYGFAYGNRTMKKIKNVITICITGRTLDHLKEHGHYQSMENVMLGDRIFDRADKKEMIILDGTTKANPGLREANWDKHLTTVYNIAMNLK